MYGKPPPLPPPIPNEPPSSFHPAPPPPPCQPPPPHSESIPSNSVPPSHGTQVRPPFPSSNFGGFMGPNYQQPLQYPILYNAQQFQYGGDNSRAFAQARPPQPSYVPPRLGYNPGIRPLMPPQFDHPPSQFNQSNQIPSRLDHGNWASSQLDRNNQPSSQFDQNQPPSQFDQNQPPSQFDHNNQVPLQFQPPSQFDHNSQPPSQFDCNSQPPSRFDQNQPPSKFDHNSQPPSRFDQNQPPSKFNCNSQPPSRFDQNQPPSKFDHNSQPPSRFDQNQPSSKFGHNSQPPSRFDQNQPPSKFDHNSQRPSQFDQNQPLSKFDHNSQPLSQFDQNQPSSEFDHDNRLPSLFDQNQPPSHNRLPSLFGQNQPPSCNNRLPSLLDHNRQPPHTPQLDHQRQYDSQQPSSHTVETSRLPFYQLPSGNDSTGPKPLMDLPQVPLNKEELVVKEPYGTGSSDQRPVADATVNNGNTNFHPVPYHIAAQHKPSQRRTLLPGNPYHWTPHHHSEQTQYGGDEDYYDPEPADQYTDPSDQYTDDDYHEPYHSIGTREREREVEKPPPQTISAETLFGTTDQQKRPTHFVIILRGLPGSGKTYAAKLIKEKELANGFSAPRILSLDDYFLVEVEKKVTDPTSGKKIKKKVMEYEYDAAMEEHYRASLFKSFNKTLDDGYFPVIIIDAINHKVSHFYQCWSAAKMKGFEVYICEMNVDVDQCVSQNMHNRTVEEITQLKHEWEETPHHIIRLDADSLLHDTNENTIDEVEMVGAETTDSSPSTGSRVDQWIKQQQEDEGSNVVKSKWENLSLTGEDKLDQLDGFSRKRKRSVAVDESSEISLTDYLNRQEKKFNKPGKKRVRWADLEAEKEKERKKEIGFHIGGEWTKITEEEAEGLLRGNSTIK